MLQTKDLSQNQAQSYYARQELGFYVILFEGSLALLYITSAIILIYILCTYRARERLARQRVREAAPNEAALQEELDKTFEPLSKFRGVTSEIGDDRYGR
jgi:hypothetical protein